MYIHIHLSRNVQSMIMYCIFQGVEKSPAVTCFTICGWYIWKNMDYGSKMSFYSFLRNNQDTSFFNYCLLHVQILKPKPKQKKNAYVKTPFNFLRNEQNFVWKTYYHNLILILAHSVYKPYMPIVLNLKTVKYNIQIYY